MIITIDTYNNGCTISYNDPLTINSMTIPMTNNSVRLVGTDEEIIDKLTEILTNLRASS